MVRKIATLSFVLILFSTPSVINAEGSVGNNPGAINTLDYFVSKHLDKTLTGTHNQNQLVTGNISYYVKWSKDTYEIHSWDSDYIYLREDHGWKYDQGYAFSPGRWMKRSMKIGESISELGNSGYYFKYGNCQLLEVQPLPYTTTLESHMTDYDLAGDLGKQEIIVLKYDYATQVHPGNYEKFYYSKEWGWVKWELYINNSLVKTSVFNKVSNSPVLPEVSSSCTRGGTYNGSAPYVGQMSQLKLRNNEVVRVEGSPAVYYISESGQRITIPSYAIFLSYGHTDTQVKIISQNELKMYPEAKYIQLLGTSLIYKLEGNTKRSIASAALRRLNVSSGDIVSVNKENLNAYKSGKIIKF